MEEDFDLVEPLYGWHDIAGSNPFNLTRAAGNAPSLMAAHVWMPAPAYVSQPIPAHSMAPLQPNDMVARSAPWVPHSASVSGLNWTSPRTSRQSDIPLVALKAPKVF